MKDWGQVIADKKLRSNSLDKKLRSGNCLHIGMKLNSRSIWFNATEVVGDIIIIFFTIKLLGLFKIIPKKIPSNKYYITSKLSIQTKHDLVES